MSAKLFGSPDVGAALQPDRQSRATTLRTSPSVLAIHAARCAPPRSSGVGMFPTAPSPVATPVDSSVAVNVGMTGLLPGETARPSTLLGPYRKPLFDQRKSRARELCNNPIVSDRGSTRMVIILP